MKKTICVLMLLCITLLTACGSDETKNKVPKASPKPTETARHTAEPVPTPTLLLPISSPTTFTFCSGVGAWSTTVELNKDGTFSGHFSDANAGETGEGYIATVYLCDFAGNFSDIKKVDTYSYSMTLSDLTTTEKSDTEKIEEEVRYVYTTPYGLEGGEEILLFLPGIPIEDLPEAFLNWYPGDREYITSPEGELNCYGLYNVAQEQGFFSEV
ncbi:MAG: hypothetical protein E7408_00240 [Ruminococcaceae bacterium]|nr:hypothetical protein [Oscillospiraceae bacterium]